MLLRALEVLGFILVFVLLITQVVIPLWTNRPMFQLFRSSRRQLESKIADAQEQLDEKALRTQLKELRQNLINQKQGE